LQSGQILGTFSQDKREAIWSVILLYSADYLISFFSGFFEDVNYLKSPVDCVMRLITLLSRDIIFSALERSFSDVNQTADQYIIQESESICGLKSGNLTNRVDLEMRQVFIFVMRNYFEMPIEPKRKNVLAKSTGEKTDQAVLCEFAGLTYRLGFEFEKIRSLMQQFSDKKDCSRYFIKNSKTRPL
jgi:hypothetical protein